MNFISMFSGAGGLDQGFIAAGWHPVVMIDNWRPAVKTLKKNHPELENHIYAWDLAALEYARFEKAVQTAHSGPIDCVIGGPPCQAYSRLNQNQLFDKGRETERNLNDPRRSLFMDFLRLASHVRPSFVVMENVFDLKTRKLGGRGVDSRRPIIDVITEEFDSAGFSIEYGVLKTQEFNVPQMRKRLIFIGIRKDLRLKPSLPSTMPLTTSVIAEFSKIRPEHPNQDRKSHSPKWIEKVRHIPQGGYYNHLPLEYKVLKEFVYARPIVGSESGIALLKSGFCARDASGIYYQDKMPGHLVDNAQFFEIMPRMGTYLRRIKETVSHTVTRNPLIHPTENREITVREKAAIQTFPPWYEFCGTIQEQHVLVGNAVPCNLGKAIAEHIEGISR